jgi:hypothetical protein
MNRGRILGVSAVAGLCVAAVSADAVSSELAFERSVVGTWQLLSLYEEDESGHDVHTFGRNPDGQLMLDAAGHFSLKIGGDFLAAPFPRDSVDVGAALVSARTPLLAYSGKYSFSHEHTIHLHIERGLAPLDPSANVMLIGDRMELTSSSEQSPTGSNYSRLVWQRLR